MYPARLIFLRVIQRDLQVYLFNKGESLVNLLFFIMIVTIFPLSVGPFNQAQLWLVPCILWIANLLAMLMAHESMLRSDFQNGTFEVFVQSNMPMSILVLVKVFAHWLITGLPLLVLSPLLAAAFNFPSQGIYILFLSLLIASPILSLVATLGSALTISLPRGGALLAILILPLYIPILVLASSACMLSLEGLDVQGHMALLAAVAIAAMLFLPAAIAKAIRVSIT